MKTVSLLMIAFVAFSCISEQSNLKSDLETANLKGNVWKIGKTVHDAHGTCACPAAMKTECNQTEFIYDSKGKLQVSYTIDENGRVNDSSNYIYNKRGICSEIIKFNSKKSVGKEVPVYQKANLTGYLIYNENGKIETTLKYLNAGNEISEEITLNSNGEVLRSVQNEFLNGHLISQTEKDSSGNVRSISKFKRNENNDIIEYIVLIIKDNQEIKFAYDYEYDSTGNWIKQTRFYSGQIESIVVRNIVYHTTDVNSIDV
jgi:antitoxin component YwqK of YwqJK toxin-antitoxin module